MNEIINRFLLAGQKLMPEKHLKPPGFICSACGPSAKNKGRIQKIKKTGDSRYIYQNELDKAYKDLLRRTASDNVLRDRASNIAKNLKYDQY